MPNHDYSPREALDLLLRTIRRREPELEVQLQAVIDAGKDVVETEPASVRSAIRQYRKTVRFSDEEALRMAVDALQAHFVEQPLFVQSAVRNFTAAAVGRHREPWDGDWLQRQEPTGDEGIGTTKELVIEVRTETQITDAEEQTVRLQLATDKQIEEQSNHIKGLLELIDFHN
jgi:hypothetical protein